MIRLTEQNDGRLITEERAMDIYQRARKLQVGSGTLRISIFAKWAGELRWARNRVAVASDRRDISILVLRQNDLGTGRVDTNQVDDMSLTAAVRAAERKMLLGQSLPTPSYDGIDWTPPLLPFPDTSIWSDSTFSATPEQRGALAQVLTKDAENQQLISSGFLQMCIGELQTFGEYATVARKEISSLDIQGKGRDREARDVGYLRYSGSQCSMTVRHPKGTGSGWAGLTSYDWSAINAELLAKTALDKCVSSLNPVAIEPGRYTVILEPLAVAQLTRSLAKALEERLNSERGRPHPFSMGADNAIGVGRSKLGLKVVDERISIDHDPMDSLLGTLPALGLGPVTWIDHGILKALGYDRERYALNSLNENVPTLPRGSYRITGGNTSVDEMIATTKRGLLVTRFSQFGMIDMPSLLCTGFTRDGFWLIENGKLSKAVKNMRFIDSPLFVLNQIEQIGISVPVFSPTEFGAPAPVVVPTIKSNDFAFTSTIDAI